MKIEELEKGHAVTLSVSVGSKACSFDTTIEELAPDFALLAPIVANGLAVGFNEGCFIDFLYTADDKVYAWNDVSVQLVRFKGKVYHKVTLSGEGTPYNRRNAFRVYIGEEMTLVTFTSSGPKQHKVLVKDLSATGMGIISKEEWETAHTVRLMLPLSASQTLPLTAKIVRKLYDSERHRFLYGCRFVEQNKILSQYLMKLQAEKQRNRLR